MAPKNTKSNKEYPFVIFDKTTSQYAGCTRFYEDSLTIDIIRLGYNWLGKTCQGTGISKNVKQLLFEFAFEKLQVQKNRPWSL